MWLLKKREEFEIQSVISVTELFLSWNHILIICVCLVAQSYLTPHNPMDYSPLGSSVHGISWQEYRSGLPFSASRDFPDPRIEPTSPASLALHTDSLPMNLFIII